MSLKTTQKTTLKDRIKLGRFLCPICESKSGWADLSGIVRCRACQPPPIRSAEAEWSREESGLSGSSGSSGPTRSTSVAESFLGGGGAATEGKIPERLPQRELKFEEHLQWDMLKLDGEIDRFCDDQGRAWVVRALPDGTERTSRMRYLPEGVLVLANPVRSP